MMINSADVAITLRFFGNIYFHTELNRSSYSVAWYGYESTDIGVGIDIPSCSEFGH